MLAEECLASLEQASSITIPNVALDIAETRQNEPTADSTKHEKGVRKTNRKRDSLAVAKQHALEPAAKERKLDDVKSHSLRRKEPEVEECKKTVSLSSAETQKCTSRARHGGMTKSRWQARAKSLGVSTYQNRKKRKAVQELQKDCEKAALQKKHISHWFAKTHKQEAEALTLSSTKATREELLQRRRRQSQHSFFE